MARIVVGMGTSHTPMLNAPPTDWPRFIERDSKRTNLLDVEGRMTSYDEQLKHAPAGITAMSSFIASCITRAAASPDCGATSSGRLVVLVLVCAVSMESGSRRTL